MLRLTNSALTSVVAVIWLISSFDATAATDYPAYVQTIKRRLEHFWCPAKVPMLMPR